MTDRASIPTRGKPAPSDVIGTVILGAVGAAALIIGFGYGFLEKGGQIGAGFLPVVTGAFIFLASLAELVRMYFFAGALGKGLMSMSVQAEQDANAAITQNKAEVAETRGDDRGTGGGNLITLKIFGLLLLALFLIPVIGLLLALTAMMLTVIVWVERKPLVPAVLTTAGVFVLAYLIFVVLLGIPLPEGMLGLV